jgi:hypothetical protein
VVKGSVEIHSQGATDVPRCWKTSRLLLAMSSPMVGAVVPRWKLQMSDDVWDDEEGFCRERRIGMVGRDALVDGGGGGCGGRATVAASEPLYFRVQPPFL